MRSVSRIPVAVAVLFLTVILGGCDATSVRRPLRHSEQYRAAIAEYKTAVVLPSETDQGNDNRAWNQPLPADSPVRATVTGRAHMDIIKVNYPDAAEPRIVHPPQDYTNNLEVRVNGSTLYVYRAVTLWKACLLRSRSSTTTVGQTGPGPA
jgi:hypothetical protein